MSTDGGLAKLYRDLHAHPELGFAEKRTASIIEKRLRSLAFEVTTGIGTTGVVGVLRNGAGPTVLLRADTDGLPVEEKTGLPYASRATAPDGDEVDVPVMHACGHDMHVTCLLGACAELAADESSWAGTVMAVFQPAEELITGARAMIDDGIFERCGYPDVVLAQHIIPFPAGAIGLRAGTAWASADSLKITLHGRGAHGSQPQAAVDPVVMAAATVMRLQGVVSREIAATDMAVVNVGASKAGNKDNIIPDTAELLISVRTLDSNVRDTVLAAISRIVRAEAAASGAPRDPEIESIGQAPVVINDERAVERTRPALETAGRVFDPGPLFGSEDAGDLATAAGVPMVYWVIGCADPALFEAARTTAEISSIMAEQPVNHSALFAPVIEPTLTVGVNAMVAAAKSWLRVPT